MAFSSSAFFGRTKANISSAVVPMMTCSWRLTVPLAAACAPPRDMGRRLFQLPWYHPSCAAGVPGRAASFGPLTRETGEIIGTYVYRLGLGSGSRDYGLSTAVGLVNGVISLVLIISANRISKKRMGTGIW